MFKKKKPSVAYVLLISTAVILFWRGTWGLMDLLIFPNDQLLSYVFSIIAGIVILIVTHKLVDELL